MAGRGKEEGEGEEGHIYDNVELLSRVTAGIR